MTTELPPPPLSTRFAGLPRWQAVAVLCVTAGVLGVCLWASLARETVPTEPKETRGDGEFYVDVVGRVHAGTDYYQAVYDALKERGYVPHSMFNWRPPLYAWLFGHLPGLLWEQALLAAGALATMFLGSSLLRREAGPVAALALVLLLIGPLGWLCYDDVSLFTELWAGMLIALSVVSSALGRRGLGVTAGLLALFLRELTLPYVLIALVLDWRQKRRWEVAGWLAGLALYAVYLSWHAHQLSARIPPSSLVHAGSWLQYNGVPFIVLTCQSNAFLLRAPAWIAAVYLTLGLLGLAGWRGTAGTRSLLTVGAFVTAFAFVGIKPDNAYWGMMYNPLLAFGVVWAPVALRDLFRAALGRCRSPVVVAEKPALLAVGSGA